MKIGSAEWNRLIAEGADSLGIDLNSAAIDQFAIHAGELLKWTRKTNLTAITDSREVAVKHFLDSIVPAPLIPSGARLLDIGSGGGFPGIPLKILIPSLSVTLIDAVRKKVSFMSHVIGLLQLSGIKARHLRVEELEQEPQFDVVVSRALFSLKALMLQAVPLLKNEGLIIGFKGHPAEAEKEYAQWRSGKNRPGLEAADFSLAVDIRNYTLPLINVQRTLFIIKRSDAAR